MMATKVDFKRELTSLYAAGREPGLVEVPELAFLMIDGHGDPNTAIEYRQAIEALYSVAYAAKFAVKLGPAGVDYGVMPLEGLWWATDVSAFAREDKSSWEWTMMVMQPDLVTAQLFEAVRAKVAAKKAPDLIGRLRLERFGEGLAAQVLHIGPYGAEAPIIHRLHAFITEQGYVRTGKHHEIYLSDPRRVAPEKLKTIVRQPVKPAA